MRDEDLLRLRAGLQQRVEQVRAFEHGLAAFVAVFGRHAEFGKVFEPGVVRGEDLFHGCLFWNGVLTVLRLRFHFVEATLSDGLCLAGAQ